MSANDQLLTLLYDSVSTLGGETSIESWPLRVNTGVALGFGFDFQNQSSFAGSINAFNAVGFRIFNVACDSHLVYRERSHLVEDSHYLLSLQLSGQKTVEQNNRSTLIHAGEFTLYDSTAPVALRIGDNYRSINIRFPKSDLTPQNQRILDDLSVETSSVRDGLAPLVWTTLLGLSQNPDQLAPYSDVRHSLVEMMVLMMKARKPDTPSQPHADAKLDSVRQFIVNQLADPELSVETIARANYMSVRSLHKLFAEIHETPAAWVRTQRVQAAKRILSHPLQDATITDVAQQCGFSSIAQFSHVFKQSTGLTPTAYRDLQHDK